MSIEIRSFIIQDTLQARQLWESLPGMGLSSADQPPELANFLERNPHTCFVGVENGQVIGTVLGGSDGRRGYLYHLAVSADHQRHGLGSTLVKTCLAALQAQGVQKCHIFVITDNQDGLEFWKSQAWTLRHDILLMSKDLPASKK